MKKNKKRGPIEYKEIIKEDRRIIVYQDVYLKMMEQEDYLKNMDKNPKKYTQERYNKVKDYFGLIVLQTNCMDKSVEEIYKLYKRRWKIETYFDYLKNTIEFNGLYIDDYYRGQGMAFIALISGLIYSKIKEIKIEAKLIGMSVEDILLELRFIKLHKIKNKWDLSNISKNRKELMDSMSCNIYNEFELIKKKY